MTMPIASQMIRRSHVSPGRLAIKASEITIPRMGTRGTSGVLKGRCSSGRRTRRIHTPAHTITNASNVPMLTSSPRIPMGTREAKMATNSPTVMDEIHGVRNLGCTCLLYTSDAADEEDSVDLGG